MTTAKRNKTGKLFRFTTIFILSLILISNNSFSQVSEYIGEIPAEIQSQYPFLNNKFYNVDCPQEDESLGYFIFSLEKNKLQSFYQSKLTDTLSKLLDQYGFYKRGTCFTDLNLCVLTGVSPHKLLQGYKLVNTNQQYSIWNNTILNLAYSFDFNAHFKIYEYESSVLPPRICEERISFSPDFKLIDINFSSNLWFSKGGQSQISITNNAIINGNIIFGGCNIFCQPYCSPNSYRNDFYLNSIIDFSTFDELFSLFILDTKKIKITEDGNNYYVYCVKAK